MENREEEHIGSPIITNSENSSEEIQQTEETETIDLKNETENMEVHHHPNVEKKNFKEYLLEGLMIFLAVTMGFFAESIRENITKHEKEHQIMEMMVEDLKHDTTQITLTIKAHLIKVSELDTLRNDIIKASKQNLSGDEYRRIYYIFRRYGGSRDQYYPVARALNLIEKEGFGLIRNQNISDTILRYKELNFKVADQKELIFNNQFSTIEFSNQIFDIELLNEFIDNLKAIEILNSSKKFTLLNKSTVLLKNYAFTLFRTRSSINNLIVLLKDKKTSAERLISQIQKEYHLKNE